MLTSITGESTGKYNIRYILYIWIKIEDKEEGEGEIREQEFFLIIDQLKPYNFKASINFY